MRSSTLTCPDCGDPVTEPGRRCLRCQTVFARRALRAAAAPPPRLPRSHQEPGGWTPTGGAPAAAASDTVESAHPGGSGVDEPGDDNRARADDGRPADPAHRARPRPGGDAAGCPCVASTAGDDAV